LDATDELIQRIRSLPPRRDGGGVDPEQVIALISEQVRDKSKRSTVNITWPPDVAEAVDMICRWSGKSKTEFVNEAVYFTFQVFITLLASGNPIDAEAFCRVAFTLRLAALNQGREQILAKLRGIDHIVTPKREQPTWAKLTSPGLSQQEQ